MSLTNDTIPKVLDLCLTSGTATANRDLHQDDENRAVARFCEVGGTGENPGVTGLSSRRSVNEPLLAMERRS